MVAIEQLVFGILLAALALLVVWRLSSALKALSALWRRPQATETDITPEETVSIEREVFVEEPAVATDRLFDNDSQNIGSYLSSKAAEFQQAYSFL